MKPLLITLVTLASGALFFTAAAQDKKDTIHVVGHAHMDMNWLWTTQETRKMAQDNLRQAVAFMDEFPDYRMVQSQAAVYDFVQKADPELFELVKKYVKTGRLELIGGEWTEGDTNMSSGEGIARSFLIGQRYFLQNFGKMARIGWLPDNFGHVSQLPQLLKLSGCDYFYFHRCKPYLGSFWWTGVDGSTVLCYANDTYNGDINEAMSKDLARFAPDKHRILQITGEGDHGGGPTRANIDKVHELDSRADYPAVKFTSAETFYRRLENEMDGRPTHKGEMQFIFEGCYTTVADTKEGNRNSENSLFTSEVFNSLRWLKGEKYPATEFNELWKTVTFNQFHDILPGSAIYEANKEAHARYMDVIWKSNDLRDRAFRRLADEISFKTGLGQPIVAFNLQPIQHQAIVEAEVYSHEPPVTVKPASWGDFYDSKNISTVDLGNSNLATVLVSDGAGKTYPAQIVWSKKTPPGYISKIRFVADNIPAGGYKTFYVNTTKPGADNTPVASKDLTSGADFVKQFDTDFFTVKVNMRTGDISSLVDKRSGKEYVREGEELNKLRVYLEDRKGGMKSWTINKIVAVEDVKDVESVRVVETGPVRACIETVKTWGKSKFVIRTIIYKAYPRIEYEMEAHWLETGDTEHDSPMLRAHFPLNISNPHLLCQTPFDVVERPADGLVKGDKAPLSQSGQSEIYGVTPEKADGQEVPVQKWLDVTDGQNGIALLNKTKYGYSFHKGDLRMTLFRSAGYPDIYPNIGKFNVHYALYPHSGDWTNGVWTEGEDYNIPVYAAEPPSLAIGKSHATRPEEASLYSVTDKNVIISGIKQSEDGKMLVVRLVETEGKATTTQLRLPVGSGTATPLNLIEFPVKGARTLAVGNGVVTVSLKPHEIVTLGVK
ncbi:MAG: glycosyl hydrolase-related protein [Tannerella sp.]|jgi:alpha-mannosidase|nr:glycosyl hydrolase-related protein [Tannerella sp.]